MPQWTLLLFLKLVLAGMFLFGVWWWRRMKV